jgi:hypothetical protein
MTADDQDRLGAAASWPVWEQRKMAQSDKGSPEIDSELQAHIGRHLKASYDDILVQDVPDRFLELLQSLEKKEKGDKPAEGSNAQ